MLVLESRLKPLKIFCTLYKKQYFLLKIVAIFSFRVSLLTTEGVDANCQKLCLELKVEASKMLLPPFLKFK